ncbi:MAG: aminotransferase class V-fold PLP-dependent enzyme [Gemmatimonadales bacterium]
MGERFFDDPVSVDRVRAELTEAHAGDARWDDPKNLRASYVADAETTALARDAFAAYLGSNAIYGAIAYPSLRRFEAEVVATLLRLFRAPPGAAGSITTGGTESIFLAVKTAHRWAREHRPSARRPTLVATRTAHAAFDKAADVLGMRTVRVPVGAGYRADPERMAAAIDDDTIMLVGSAPSYGYGVVDPIPELGALAERHGLWLHADGCVGGMVLPFVRDLGRRLPGFDYSVPALRSVSIDLHKYGYAFHGCSALLLRSEELLRHQRYEFDDWPVGHYATASFAGSRGGGPIASAWAVMRHLGYAGFRDRVRAMLETRDRLLPAIAAIDGLEVYGEPEGAGFAFGSTAVDMTAVGQEMSRRGWAFGPLAEPPGLIVLLNAGHSAVAPALLEDLAEVVALVRAGKVTARGGPSAYTV